MPQRPKRVGGTYREHSLGTDGPTTDSGAPRASDARRRRRESGATPNVWGLRELTQPPYCVEDLSMAGGACYPVGCRRHHTHLEPKWLRSESPCLCPR